MTAHSLVLFVETLLNNTPHSGIITNSNMALPLIKITGEDLREIHSVLR